MRAGLPLAALVLLLVACGESGEHGRDQLLDFRPGSAGGGGGSGGGSGQGGSGGGGGSGGTVFPPPQVTELTPSSGDYGTVVTITGSALGSSSRAGSELSIGQDETRCVIAPDGPEVMTWGEQSIQFHFPFPCSGAVTVRTPEGEAAAGEFSPSWLPGPGLALGSGSTALSSLSMAAAAITVAFSGSPIRIVEFGDGMASESSAPADGVVPGSFRLYRANEGSLRAFAVSNTEPPTLVDFVSDGQSWSAQPSTVTVTAEYLVAGGLSGAVTWYRDTDGWYRARNTGDGFTIDKGPITAPSHSGVVAYGADAGGGLYVGFNVDTGNFLDDIETPFVERLAPEAASFGGQMPAGSGADDYLTSLSIADRGPGVVVHYCGSDVDPFGVTGTGHACYFSGLAPSGSLLVLPERRGNTKFAVAEAAVAAAFCDGASVHVVENGSGDAGPIVAWPCATIEAVEFDTSGVPQLVLRADSNVYNPQPNPALP